MSATIQQPPQLADNVTRLLDGLRWRIRLYVFFQGMALLLAFVGLAFWISLLIDHWRLPIMGRHIVLASFGLVAAMILLRFVLVRCSATFSNQSLALLIERRYPGLQDSLATAVEFAERGDPAHKFDPQMLGQTYERATREISQVRLSTLFNAAPLGRAILIMIVLLASVVGYAMAAPRDWNIWVDRWLLSKNVDWPRAVTLVVLKPEALAGPNQIVKVAVGSDLQLKVAVELNRNDFPTIDFPESVRVYHKSRDRYTPEMDPQEPLPGDVRHYTYQFPPLLKSQEFDLAAADGELRGLRIQVVDSPAITSMKLRCKYPDYMGRSVRDETALPEMILPFGTQVELLAETNKELVKLDIHFVSDDGTITPAPHTLGSDRKSFSTAFEVASNRKILMKLHDTDGIESRAPEVLRISMRGDELPQLAVRMKGIGSAITNQARIPIVGKLSDDYGLKRLWYDYSIEVGAVREGKTPVPSSDPQERNLAQPALDRTELVLTGEAFEVEALKLLPGDKLSLQIKAADGFQYVVGEKTLGPNLAATERFPLDIVTPDQLRMILETRELMLRKRFEQIREEVRASQESLGAATPSGDGPSASTEGAAPTESPAAKPLSPLDLEGELLRVERAVQGGKKNASETMAVATSFEEIVEELANNRIDTEELRSRLEDGIARPLQKIGNVLFAELDRRLERLKFGLRASGNEAEATAAREAVLEQYDTILVAMQEVLEKMRELEDFNEALALLREILDEQERILHETQKERSTQLRRDLE